MAYQCFNIFVITFSDAPKLILRLGHALHANNIKQGDDVYFECLIDSNPPIARLEWYKDVSLKSE